MNMAAFEKIQRVKKGVHGFGDAVRTLDVYAGPDRYAGPGR